MEVSRQALHNDFKRHTTQESYRPARSVRATMVADSFGRVETQELAPLEHEELNAPQVDKEVAERRRKRLDEATDLVWSMVRRCGLPPGWSEHDAEGETFYYHC